MKRKKLVAVLLLLAFGLLAARAADNGCIPVNDPTINCPGDFGVHTDPGVCSAVVNFDLPTATDDCGDSLSPSCEPSPGSTFSVGEATVTCTATDSEGNSTSCSFRVTVTDIEAPSLTCPGSITVGTESGKCTAVVSYDTPTASDNCPCTPSVTCTPASGSTFHKGNNSVTCTTEDANGNSQTCSFSITV